MFLLIPIVCSGQNFFWSHSCPPPSFCGSFTDARDGKTYSCIIIGFQFWMGENLAYLPSVVGSSTGSRTTAYYYVYGYEGTTVATAKATANFTTYGVLYNYPASTTACPSGWHIPSQSEYQTLFNYLTNMRYGYDGSGTDIAKSLASSSGWTASAVAGQVGNDQGSNNLSLLALTHGGWRDVGGYFSSYISWGTYIFSEAYSSTEMRDLNLTYQTDTPVTTAYYDKAGGESIRCIRD